MTFRLLKSDAQKESYLCQILRILTLLSFPLTVLADPPRQGPRDSGGGDSHAQEFTLVAYDVLESVSRSSTPLVSIRGLLEAVQKTKVNSTSDQLVDRAGRVVEALNFPSATDPRILIHRSSWSAIQDNEVKKQLLVFHEYLGIMGIDDSSYQVSRRLFERSVCQRSPQVRKAIELAVGIECSRMRPEDLNRVTDLWIRDAEQISPGDFEFLSRLETLVLGDLGQPLNRIKSKSFSGLSRLKEIHIVGGSHEIQSDAFAGLNSKLTIKFTQFPKNAVVRSGAFAGSFQNIRILTASPLTFEEGAFAEGSYGTLEISPEAFGAKINRNLLANIKDVKRLILARHEETANHFVSVDDGAFERVTKVAELSIALDVNQSDLSAFKVFSNVKTLSLQGSGFGGLTPEFFTSFSNVKSLVLKGDVPLPLLTSKYITEAMSMICSSGSSLGHQTCVSANSAR